MAANSNKQSGAGRGLVIAAVVILLLGLGFGIKRLSSGLAAYQERPSQEEEEGKYALLRLLDELEEFLPEVENPEELDADAVIREYLEDTRMTPRQQEEFREIFETALELVKEGGPGRELARNHILRESIYIRNMTDREDAERQLRYAILFAGGSIVISALVAAPMLIAAGKKRRKAPQAAVPSGCESCNNKEL